MRVELTLAGEIEIRHTLHLYGAMRRRTIVSYQPEPIDTSRVTLPDDIEALVDKLARNTHEVWSQTRIDQGWSFGQHRDDDRREHPCLIHYEELSESEKDVDRNTAVQVLKTIIALGYSIDHKDGENRA